MKFASALFLILGSTVPAGVSSFVLPSVNVGIASSATHHLKQQQQQQQRIPSLLQSSTETEATTNTAPPSATTSAPPPSSIIEGMPSHSPATSLPNQIYNWRGYNTRYQVSGPEDADHTLLLVHGLFVNSDHWRKTLTGLHTANGDEESGKKPTCRVYALDLLGCGWSDKPSRDDPTAQLVNGENGRFVDCDSICYRERQQQQPKSSSSLKKLRSAPTLENIPLGTSSGGNILLASKLELRHPLRSPYNFYTWAEQLADFAHDVIRADNAADEPPKRVTLVANSIGTMSSLQSILDEPQLFNGCFVINPNFRELHSAEVPFSQLTMPLVRRVQSLLREKGHGLFRTLATPETVATILKEPYAVTDAIDEELVSVLLDPLLTEGADEVVFDTLSYSAGPLPEQQLSSADFPKDCPVWVVYGKEDPWTPPRRVENLKSEYSSSPVERVVGLEGAGHCPHDEVPQRVNELILEFLDRLS